MLKSDLVKMDSVFKSYEKISLSITDLLNNMGNMEKSKFAELRNLYDSKREKLNIINNYIKSEEFKELPVKKLSQIESKMASFEEQDKLQVEKIKTMTSDLKTKIIKLSKQKSLLNYTKGNL